MDSDFDLKGLLQALVDMNCGGRILCESPEHMDKDALHFKEELNKILKELLEAFAAKDSVLIGDLMEYEIAPRLEQLRAFLQELT